LIGYEPTLDLPEMLDRVIDACAQELGATVAV
jgi:hypothetical protein